MPALTHLPSPNQNTRHSERSEGPPYSAVAVSFAVAIVSAAAFAVAVAVAAAFAVAVAVAAAFAVAAASAAAFAIAPLVCHSRRESAVAAAVAVVAAVATAATTIAAASAVGPFVCHSRRESAVASVVAAVFVVLTVKRDLHLTSRLRTVLLPFGISIFLIAPTQAQSNTATLYGIATDPQSRPIPNAKITLRSTDLAATRTTLTDATGRFGLAALVPGAYTLEAREHTLTLRRPLRLTLGLGSSTQLTLKLDIEIVRQKTTVTARPQTSEGNTVAPPINQSEPSLSTFFAGTVVTYLPLRDRDIAQYDQLAANTHDSPAGPSVDGQRPESLLTQLDGVDANSPLLGATHGEENRPFLLPQTMVREFQIVTSGVPAPTGQTASGLINVVTKEGSNKLHGEAFYTGRPAALTAAGAFGQSLDAWQNVFGLSLGGPIRRNRTFFYTGFEQDFLHKPTVTLFEPQAPGTVVPTSLLAQQGQIVERSFTLAYALRLDKILTPTLTLNAEVALNRLRIQNLNNGQTRTTATQANASALSGQSLFTKAGLTSLVNPRTVNQALLAWSTDHRNLTPNATAPEVVINGFGILGGSSLGPHLFTSSQLQAADSLSILHGTRLLELGAAFHHDPAYEQREPNLNGRFDYTSLAAFLSHQPRRFQQTFLTGNPRYQASINEFALYANTRLDLRPRLTLTAGLRWTAQLNPRQIPSDLTQFQPRLGLAWNPASKTVLRVSTGLYAAPTPTTLFHRVLTDNGTQTLTADSYFDPAFLTPTPAAPTNLTTPHAEVHTIAPTFRNPTSLQAAASLDQTLSPKLTLRAAYLHAAAWRLPRQLDTNLSPPLPNGIFPAVRPIPGTGRLLTLQSQSHSDYNALTASVLSQISRRSQFTANYTLSATHDDATLQGPYDLLSTLNSFSPSADRAASNLDQRQTLTVSAIFNLPAGLKLNPLFLTHSGAPYTPVTGFDTQNDANDLNDRALLSGAVAARNSLRQPAFSSLDLRLVKDFTLKGEGHHLDLFMDVFNLAGAQNRNFGPNQISLFGTPAAPIFSAAQPLYAPGTTRPGGPRSIQLTARLVAF